MRHGYASNTQADLSLNSLYTYLTSFCRAASRLGFLLFSIITYFSHTTKTVTSWADAQTAQIISFAILLLFKLWQLCKNCKRHAYIMPKIPIMNNLENGSRISNSVDPDTSYQDISPGLYC